MKSYVHRFTNVVVRMRRRDQRGIALVTTLLLLLLLTALSLSMVMSVRSDMLVNGYYRNFRGSFYAADSGLNVARREMVNELVAAIPNAFNPAVAPMPAGTEGVVQGKVLGLYQNATTLVPSAQLGKTWPEKFKITSLTLTPDPDPLKACSVQGGNPGATCASPLGNITKYIYKYNYTMTAVGQSQGNEAATLTDQGSIQLTANLVPTSSKQSFAAWGMFINSYNVCTDNPLVPGLISGPVFTNGSWNFGNGSYTFTNSVGQAGQTAGYEFSSGCIAAAAPSAKDKNGNTIAPNFQNGFNLNQPKVGLPSNSFDQERAVIDGRGSSCSTGQLPPCAANPVSNSELQNLQNVNQQQWTTKNGNPVPGVYLPYKIVDGQPTFTGGGILVQGNAQVTLSTSGTNSQIYQINQGGTITTVTVTAGSPGQTTVKSGSQTLNISGVPTELDPATGAIQGPATMLYVDGDITSLSGPEKNGASTGPAIQDGTALTISSSGSVTVTGDIKYATEPVTLTASGSTPIDSPVQGGDKGQALGIFTANGDIQLANSQTNKTLEIDASLATLNSDPNVQIGLLNTGASINTLTIVGGRIQNNIMNIGATTRNVLFDQRFANGFSPPWFPSTTVTLGGVKIANVVPAVSRRQWQNRTAFF